MRTVRQSIGAPALSGVLGMVLCLALPPLAAAGVQVAFEDNVKSGTIVIRTGERRLYLVLGGGRAIRYVVGVGRKGSQWAGKSAIEGKFIRPNWAPPESIRREHPNLPKLIASGSPSNPMGAAAMTLSGGSYAIHGTNSPKSIGGFVSHGCIRMYNADIMDLLDRVRVGTPVLVTR